MICLTLEKSPPSWRDDGVEERRIGRQARDADRPALQVARAGDVVAGDQRGQRLGDQLADADDVDVLLARDREVGDVEDAHVELPRGDELQRVRPGPRLADDQPDLMSRVRPRAHGRVDRRVDGVGGEVEGQLHGLPAARPVGRAVAGAAAGREQERQAAEGGEARATGGHRRRQSTVSPCRRACPSASGPPARRSPRPRGTSALLMGSTAPPTASSASTPRATRWRATASRSPATSW